MTPERSGACSVFTSADVTADQRTASRKAPGARAGRSRSELPRVASPQGGPADRARPPR
jgi:hypothetical protein